jgi:hypothetical protein
MSSCRCTRVVTHVWETGSCLCSAVVAAGDDVERGQGHLAWLEEIDMPRELKMCSVHYGGPPISDE